jgi:hypothetical protein
MSKLLDILKLLAVAILLIGSIVAFKIWNPLSSDDKIVELSGELAIKLCDCNHITCANRVSSEAAEKLDGQKVSRNREVGGGAHSQAHEQIMHMQRCHQLIMEGKDFTVTKADGKISSVTESVLNNIQIPLPL